MSQNVPKKGTYKADAFNDFSIDKLEYILNQTTWHHTFTIEKGLSPNAYISLRNQLELNIDKDNKETYLLNILFIKTVALRAVFNKKIDLLQVQNNINIVKALAIFFGLLMLIYNYMLTGEFHIGLGLLYIVFLIAMNFSIKIYCNHFIENFKDSNEMCSF